MAAKFFQHFVYIAASLNHVRSLPSEYADLFDDDEGFYYDVIRLRSRSFVPLKARSLQGVMPIFAVETISKSVVEQEAGKEFSEQLKRFIKNHPELVIQVSPTRESGAEIAAHMETPVDAVLEASSDGMFLFSLVDKEKLRRLLRYMLDENVSKSFRKTPIGEIASSSSSTSMAITARASEPRTKLVGRVRANAKIDFRNPGHHPSPTPATTCSRHR